MGTRCSTSCIAARRRNSSTSVPTTLSCCSLRVDSAAPHQPRLMDSDSRRACATSSGRAILSTRKSSNCAAAAAAAVAAAGAGESDEEEDANGDDNGDDAASAAEAGGVTRHSRQPGTATRASAVVRSSSTLGRLWDTVTFIRFYNALLASNISSTQLRARMTQLWAAISIIGSVIGSTVFEGLWNRPLLADGTGQHSASVFATLAYLSLLLCMYSVLLAAVFMVMLLFYNQSDGIRQMMRRVGHLVALPSICLFLGWIFFALSLPFMASDIYGTSSDTWKVSLVVSGLILVLVALGFVARFVLAKEAKAETEQQSTHRSTKRKILDAKQTVLEVFTLANYYRTMLNSTLSEHLTYMRVSRVWTSTGIVGALLTLVSFLGVQTFGEYPNSSDEVSVYATAMYPALFFNATSVFLSISFIFLVAVVPKGMLKRWLRSKSDLLFLPAIALGGGVLSLLVAVPVLAHVLYSDTVFVVAVCLSGGALLVMAAVRFHTVHAVPRGDATGRQSQTGAGLAGAAQAQAQQGRQALAWLSNADLFDWLLDSNLDESALYDRVGGMLNSLSIVAALLSLVSWDSFRERANLDQLKNNASIPNDSDTTVYGVSALLSLWFNLITLFLSTFYMLVLSVVPGHRVEKFLDNMKHVMFMPALTFIGGVTSTLVELYFFALIRYDSISNIDWALRGIVITLSVLLFFLYIFLTRRSAGVIFAAEDVVTRSNDLAQHQHTPKSACEKGISGYFVQVLRSGWHDIYNTQMAGSEVYGRVVDLWASESVIGALLSTMSFLAFQEGLRTSAIGIAPSEDVQQMYVVSVFLSLAFNIAGTCACTFFIVVLMFIPESRVQYFLRRISIVISVPNLFLFCGATAFLLAQPFLVKTLYGDAPFKVCAVAAWGVAGVLCLTVGLMRIFRPFLHQLLYYSRWGTKVHGSQFELNSAAVFAPA
eukprot:m.196102 g.196102  ORF g.196102 m.196102 type:complete len:938 (+) comp21828_c0_seq3:416-3229(+)